MGVKVINGKTGLAFYGIEVFQNDGEMIKTFICNGCVRKIITEKTISLYSKVILDEIIDNDSIWMKTNFVVMEDVNKKLWLYDCNCFALIPLEQEYINKQYVQNNNFLNEYKKKDATGWECLSEGEIKQIFKNLAKIDICNEWRIKDRVWQLNRGKIFDAKEEKFRGARSREKISILQCVAASADYDAICENKFYTEASEKSVKKILEEDWWTACCFWAEMKLYPVAGAQSEKGLLDRLGKQTITEKEELHTIQEEVIAEKKKENENNGVNTSTQVQQLLECDKRRCRLEAYEQSMLYDIKRGHWDLFESETVLDEKMVSRDPRQDIRTGIVGIDFGTKSTVVVRQDDTNKIIPIRIGTGVLASEIKESDYENPTVIECTDLNSFTTSYSAKNGRPETSCDDFFISYDAYNDYCSCSPNEFYAYYTELKQWANHEKQNVLVKDKKGNEYRFGYDIQQNVINPIELYAYYIGMYINNMRNGVYMRYLMSFPVGYSKETRELIVRSFEKGIKKSLPAVILEDAECMKQFSVNLGISEPAAYAVTALEMSGLEPQDENEKYMYGIFDFGGGTTDFDFGIWRGASEDEYEIQGYDYVLECFGADSDVTLGGENILELLAYNVYKNNKELARNKKITISLPVGETAFLGSEMMISDSQIAKRNMNLLREALRPLWHQEEGWLERYRHYNDSSDNEQKTGEYEEYIQIMLYDIEGKAKPDCQFMINTDELLDLIKNRIQKGIDAFFKCMERTFLHQEKAQEEERKVYIFLAGNSCKSVFVKELFEKTMKNYYQKFKLINENAGDDYFELIELSSEQKDDEKYIPNAKTSVAYGLVKSREGSSIKIVKNYETDAAEETRFKYFLGRERRHKFDCRLSPAETKYGAWIQFQGAAKPIIRIFYTTNAIADSKTEQLDIDNITYKEISIIPEEDKFLFIRTCEPTVIEYVIASSADDIESCDKIFKLDFDV